MGREALTPTSDEAGIPEGVSYESLLHMFDIAVTQRSIKFLEDIRTFAQSRDGFDDTDPRYAHLVQDINEELEKLGARHGTN